VLLGILSDSHGQALLVRRAVALFDSLGASHIIHCGDVGGQAVFEELVGHPCTFVWGNTDEPNRSLLAFLAAVGLHVPDGMPMRVTFAGRSFAIYHGHEPGFGAAVNGLDVDYLLHGHTHAACDLRRGGKRIINPGALVRVKEKTVATLDVETDELIFHTLISR